MWQKPWFNAYLEAPYISTTPSYQPKHMLVMSRAGINSVNDIRPQCLFFEMFPQTGTHDSTKFASLRFFATLFVHTSGKAHVNCARLAAAFPISATRIISRRSKLCKAHADAEDYSLRLSFHSKVWGATPDQVCH